MAPAAVGLPRSCARITQTGARRLLSANQGVFSRRQTRTWFRALGEAPANFVSKLRAPTELWHSVDWARVSGSASRVTTSRRLGICAHISLAIDMTGRLLTSPHGKTEGSVTLYLTRTRDSSDRWALCDNSGQRGYQWSPFCSPLALIEHILSVS